MTAESGSPAGIRRWLTWKAANLAAASRRPGSPVADTSDPERDAIHAAIQASGPEFGGGYAVLTGWALVAEWMDERGERWLSKGHAAGTALWAAKGMMHEALHGDWPDAPDAGPSA